MQVFTLYPRASYQQTPGHKISCLYLNLSSLELRQFNNFFIGQRADQHAYRLVVSNYFRPLAPASPEASHVHCWPLKFSASAVSHQSSARPRCSSFRTGPFAPKRGSPSSKFATKKVSSISTSEVRVLVIFIFFTFIYKQ